jgi:hypothetical protein
MKTFAKIIGISVSIGTLLIAAHSARANYTGLQVERQRVTLQDGTVMNQFRVYAMCTDPNDYIIACSGSPTLGNMVIQSRNADDTGAGSNFYNATGGSDLPPTAEAIALNPDVAHDTFASIGFLVAPPPIPVPPKYGLSPGFPGFNAVTQINSNNAGWFCVVSYLNQASYAGDGDPLLRVLIMQLTVSSTSNVRGTCAISGINQSPSPPPAFTIAGQTFNSIPCPSALAVLASALLALPRRRKAMNLLRGAATPVT